MLWRAIRYIGRYRDLAFVAYGSLFFATAAQLMVPQMVQGIIDTLVASFTGTPTEGVAHAIASLPAARGDASRELVLAMVAILFFAAIRAVF
jgi:hypothetical protein